jgi:hypothetical protein
VGFNAQNFIQKQREKNNINDLIHCIWYCFCYKRFYTVERELVNKLIDTKIPLIIVLTQSVDDEFTEVWKEYFKKDNYDVIDIGSLLDNKDFSITKTEDIVTENNKIYTSNALVEYYMKESIFEKVFKNVNGLYIFAVLFAGLLVALGIGVRNTKLLKSVEEVNNGKNQNQNRNGGHQDC